MGVSVRVGVGVGLSMHVDVGASEGVGVGVSVLVGVVFVWVCNAAGDMRKTTGTLFCLVMLYTCPYMSRRVYRYFFVCDDMNGCMHVFSFCVYMHMFVVYTGTGMGSCIYTYTYIRMIIHLSLKMHTLILI